MDTKKTLPIHILLNRHIAIARHCCVRVLQVPVALHNAREQHHVVEAPPTPKSQYSASSHVGRTQQQQQQPTLICVNEFHAESHDELSVVEGQSLWRVENMVADEG